jgi:hypothetical protein
MITFLVTLPALQFQVIKDLLDQAIDLSLSRMDFKEKASEIDLCNSFPNRNTSISLLCISPHPDLPL